MLKNVSVVQFSTRTSLSIADILVPTDARGYQQNFVAMVYGCTLTLRLGVLNNYNATFDMYSSKR